MRFRRLPAAPTAPGHSHGSRGFSAAALPEAPYLVSSFSNVKTQMQASSMYVVWRKVEGYCASPSGSFQITEDGIALRCLFLNLSPPYKPGYALNLFFLKLEWILLCAPEP